MQEFEKYYKKFENLFYLDINQNKKQTLLLLHGLGVNSYSWKYQIEYFKSKDYRIIVPDFPGFGLSKPIKNTNVKEISDSILSLIQNLKLKSVYAVGISAGGCVLLQMLTDKSKLFSKAVIINSFSRIWYNSICIKLYTKFRLLMSNILPLKVQAKFLAKALFAEKENEIEFFNQMKKAHFFSYRNFLRSLVKFNVYDNLRKIKGVDVLLITGTVDTTIPPYIQAELTKIPNSQHIFLEGNHVITVNNHKKVNEEIEKFFVKEWF